MSRARALLAGALVVAATLVAGVVAAPSKTRPCVAVSSRGITGGPTHVVLAPDGNLWATEGRNDRIATFDPRTQTASEFPLPTGSQPHDLAVGPDGNLWFSGFNGGIGSFDPRTHRVEFHPFSSPGSQPHLWWARDGRLYFGERNTGRLGRFDPRTGRIVTSGYNLRPNNGIHSFAEVPGDAGAWWGLQLADKLAHFNLRTGRFDRFVDLPKGSGPHWLAYAPSDRAIWIALQFSGKLARYDLATGRVTVFDLGLPPVSPAELNRRKPIAALTFMLEDAQRQALWLATLAGGEVRRFDLRTHRVVRVGCGLPFPTQTTTFANDRAGNLWVTEAPPSGPGGLGRVQR